MIAQHDAASSAKEDDAYEKYEEEEEECGEDDKHWEEDVEGIARTAIARGLCAVVEVVGDGYSKIGQVVLDSVDAG